MMVKLLTVAMMDIPRSFLWEKTGVTLQEVSEDDLLSRNVKAHCSSSCLLRTGESLRNRARSSSEVSPETIPLQVRWWNC